MTTQKLKRDDLKSYSGHTVQIMMDGKAEFADLHANDPTKAFLTVAKTSKPPDMQWTDMHPYFLSDEDIAGLIPNGPTNLFSRISLNSAPPISN